MTVELVPVPQMSVGRCSAQNCTNVTDGSVDRSGVSLCRAHRRALALTAALSDAILQFLRNGGRSPITPGRVCDPDIEDAGTHFAIGLDNLLRSVFGCDMTFNPMPLTATYGASDGYGPRWRINFDWKLGSGAQLATLDDDETDSEGCDDDDHE